jgi:FkbM family methyltransferase
MPTSTRRSRFVELTILVVAVSLLTWSFARGYYRTEGRNLRYLGETVLEDELEPFGQQFAGQSKSSRNLEEWIIRNYFQDRRGGVFLDVGANHYQRDSNTYYLETALGWSGVAIEAQSEFGAEYVTHRPNTRFVAMFASDVADKTAMLFVPVTGNKLVASSSREFTIREGAPGLGREVPSTTLTAALDQAGVARLDLLSMDIELSEPKALAGFDIDRFQPALVCIEGHPKVRQEILDYFTRHKYVAIGKYLRIDPNNLYFHPLRQ